MSMVDLENPWIFGLVVIAIWAVIWTGLGVVLFDGNALSVAVQGVAGGLAFSVTYLYVRRNE